MRAIPNTVPDNIYYPDDSTLVDDLSGLFAALSQSVQLAITDVRNDLSPQTISDSGWTIANIAPASGWSGVADANGNSSSLKGGMRKVGQAVELRFRLTRSGAALKANAQGNVGDNIICTINNTAMRPSGMVYSTFDFGPGLGTGGIRVEPSGNVVLVDAYPNATIASGNQVQISAFYFTG